MCVAFINFVKTAQYHNIIEKYHGYFANLLLKKIIWKINITNNKTYCAKTYTLYKFNLITTVTVTMW